MIELTEVDASYLERVHHEFDEDAIRRFPLISHNNFHKRIFKLYKIESNNTIIGIVFLIVAMERFKVYGKHDISIIIFKNHRGKGNGYSVVKLLKQKFENTFFIVKKDNSAMLKILRGDGFAREICADDKYEIFKSISSNKN